MVFKDHIISIVALDRSMTTNGANGAKEVNIDPKLYDENAFIVYRNTKKISDLFSNSGLEYVVVNLKLDNDKAATQVAPVAPAAPVASVAPAAPVASVAPVAPVAPAAPAPAPVVAPAPAPAAPVAPVAPAAPVASVAPVAPAAPAPAPVPAPAPASSGGKRRTKKHKKKGRKSHKFT